MSRSMAESLAIRTTASAAMGDGVFSRNVGKLAPCMAPAAYLDDGARRLGFRVTVERIVTGEPVSLQIAAISGEMLGRMGSAPVAAEAIDYGRRARVTA